jgi:hypothetical protein
VKRKVRTLTSGRVDFVIVDSIWEISGGKCYYEYRKPK